jgi:hypothetical protein
MVQKCYSHSFDFPSIMSGLINSTTRKPLAKEEEVKIENISFLHQSYYLNLELKGEMAIEATQIISLSFSFLKLSKADLIRSLNLPSPSN